MEIATEQPIGRVTIYRRPNLEVLVNAPVKPQPEIHTSDKSLTAITSYLLTNQLSSRLILRTQSPERRPINHTANIGLQFNPDSQSGLFVVLDKEEFECLSSDDYQTAIPENFVAHIKRIYPGIQIQRYTFGGGLVALEYWVRTPEASLVLPPTSLLTAVS